MGFSVKSFLVLALSLSAIYLIWQSNNNKQTYSKLNDQEYSANLDDTQLKMIRNLIKKAGTQFHTDYSMMATFIQGQLNTSISTLWNVMVYTQSDMAKKFYATLIYYDKKKYYEVHEPDNYTYNIFILQTNDTNYQSPASKKLLLKDTTQEDQISIEGLTYTKKKSQNVSSSQEAGIDLAITTAYTWNKNIEYFTDAAKNLIENNLNQQWQVVARFESLDSVHFGFKYAAVYDQWIEYIGYGLGSYVLHVYVFRNYNYKTG